MPHLNGSGRAAAALSRAVGRIAGVGGVVQLVHLTQSVPEQLASSDVLVRYFKRAVA